VSSLMGRITHFEITSDSPDAANQFYADAFGWNSEASPFLSGYHLTRTGQGAGIDGAVMSRDYQQQPVILWLEVSDIATSIAAVKAAGGSQAGDINEIPGRGLVAYVADPAGTLFGLKQTISAG